MDTRCAWSPRSLGLLPCTTLGTPQLLCPEPELPLSPHFQSSSAGAHPLIFHVRVPPTAADLCTLSPSPSFVNPPLSVTEMSSGERALSALCCCKPAHCASFPCSHSRALMPNSTSLSIPPDLGGGGVSVSELVSPWSTD